MGDIRLLAEHFGQAHALRGLALRFTPAALRKLQQRPWPGNIRELRNVVCRALLVRQGTQLDVGDITCEEQYRRAPEDTGTPPLELLAGVTLEQMMQRVERQLIESTLRRCHYHKARAAREWGLARSSLFTRLKQWGLSQKGE